MWCRPPVLRSGPSALWASRFKPSSYTHRIFLTFLLLYLLLMLFARYKCSHDPTSVFFQPTRAYSPAYSTIRSVQADRYIEYANITTGQSPQKSPLYPTICIGIASVARENARYFKTIVGSILEDLTESERVDIHLILFIAHTDPSQHPAYAEPWLHRVSDQVRLYDNATVDIDHIRSLETKEAKHVAREKALFDYRYLLNACAAVNASYVAILEDDVLAMDGWYARTYKALESVEQQMATKMASKWLYLRLFYTEQFLAWNSKEWVTYLFFSILTAISVAFLVLCGICVPLLIALFFAAGRVTVFPIPEGVHEMSRFGCCSQGLIFQHSRVPDLVRLYERKRLEYVDMITEEYANEHTEVRWAVTPTVIQHMGRESSKIGEDQPKDGFGAAGLWNFAFERNDVETLRREHEAVH